jgi:hypothetical protein
VSWVDTIWHWWTNRLRCHDVYCKALFQLSSERVHLFRASGRGCGPRGQQVRPRRSSTGRRGAAGPLPDLAAQAFNACRRGGCARVIGGEDGLTGSASSFLLLVWCLRYPYNTRYLRALPVSTVRYVQPSFPVYLVEVGASRRGRAVTGRVSGSCSWAAPRSRRHSRAGGRAAEDTSFVPTDGTAPASSPSAARTRPAR